MGARLEGACAGRGLLAEGCEHFRSWARGRGVGPLPHPTPPRPSSLPRPWLGGAGGGRNAADLSVRMFAVRLGVAALVHVGGGGGEALEPAGLWLPMLAWWELGPPEAGMEEAGLWGSATRGFVYPTGSWHPFTIRVILEQVRTTVKG